MNYEERLKYHEAWFKSYVENFIACVKFGKEKEHVDVSPLHLKVEHTAHVLANAKVIVASQGFVDMCADVYEGVCTGVVGENMPLEELAHACHLAALYHDIGRFPQYRDYGTFADALSVNHATLSARTLVREGMLKTESKRIRRLVVGAVAMHNRYALPRGIIATLRLVTDVVRDADKLDIIRIMAPQLSCASLEEARKQAKSGGQNVVTMHVKDEPELWSDAIVQDALEGRVAKYTDMRYINDFRIVIGTWMKELRFDASLEHLAKSGLMDEIFAGLPKNAFMEELTEYLLEPLKKYNGVKYE